MNKHPTDTSERDPQPRPLPWTLLCSLGPAPRTHSKKLCRHYLLQFWSSKDLDRKPSGRRKGARIMEEVLDSGGRAGAG